jgi:hypothetical protein
MAERHTFIFATVALYAHGASFLGDSAKLAIPVDCLSYLARATEQLLRLHTSPRNLPDAQLTDNISQPTDTTDYADNADRPEFLHAIA